MYIIRRASVIRQLPNSLQRRFRHTPPSQTLSEPLDVSSLLSTPSWSVASLFPASSQTFSSSSNITRTQLHHLLRLSALPLPTSETEESKMIADLESQLQFVRAIQEVDTEGVEPLRSIRDETKEAEREVEIGMEELREDFEREEVVGRRGRIRNRVWGETTRKDGELEHGKRDADAGREGWDLLRQAPKKTGRFVVVETGND